ncbi:MAG: M3 family metallopeptidase [Bacteroidales bacterium]
MKKILSIFLTSLLVFSSCNKTNNSMENPFFSEYNTPFQVPPFDLIDTSHYLPAIAKGIAGQQAEIDAILNNSEPPSFANTILTYDKSGRLLRKVSSVFGSLNSANTNPVMQGLNRKISPMTTKHRDNISLNDKLFLRVKSVYDTRFTSNLDTDQIRVVEKYYTDFVRNGANLNETDKEKLRRINEELSVNQIKFNENHLAETNTNFRLVVEKLEDMDGLSNEVIAAAAETAKAAGMEGKWIFTLQKPSLLPFLTYAKNRDLREKLYRGYFMRGDNNNDFDNKETILKIVNLRAEKANLLGYKTYADYIIENNMAKTPEAVSKFLNELMVPALAIADKDRDEMQKIIDREGGNFKLASWDWWYYSEKLKKEKYDLDEAEMKPYFSLTNVRDGMFYVANKLYGIRFTRIPDAPVYHPEVEVFEVNEANGSHVGVLYLDYHPRPGKNAGAWCGRFRSQSYEDGKKIYPVVTIVTNFTRPSGDTPALLSWDETQTLFHEFGHSLAGLFTDGKYDRTAGNLPRDMVELPSQIMENWAGEPDVLKVYAKHYKTGEVIPDDLIQRMEKASVFNQGFITVEYIAASVLDIDWHSINEAKQVDVNEFEKESMNRINLMDEIIPRYRTTYFSHINGGYAAGYYVYLWAAVLDSDAFQAFVDSGDIYNPEIATRFRKYILTEGGKDEGMVQYLKFRGKDPSKEPLLKKRGLL